LKLTLHNS